MFAIEKRGLKDNGSLGDARTEYKDESEKQEDGSGEKPQHESNPSANEQSSLYGQDGPPSDPSKLSNVSGFHLGITLLSFVVIFAVALLNLQIVMAGPIGAGSAVAACYTACNTGWVTCLASYGIVAGVVGPVGWWAWLFGAPAVCSAAQGACMAACTAGGLALVAAPTP